MMVLELIRIENMGQGSAERLARELSSGNSFEPIPIHHIKELFMSAGIPLAPLKGHDYYVYYAFHPSSGYKTVLYVNEDEQISFKIEEPKGGVFCAFWSEIIVFTLKDHC